MTTLGKPHVSAVSEDTPGSAYGSRDSLENQLRRKTVHRSPTPLTCVLCSPTAALPSFACCPQPGLSLQLSSPRVKGSKSFILIL